MVGDTLNSISGDTFLWDVGCRLVKSPHTTSSGGDEEEGGVGASRWQMCTNVLTNGFKSLETTIIFAPLMPTSGNSVIAIRIMSENQLHSR